METGRWSIFRYPPPSKPSVLDSMELRPKMVMAILIDAGLPIGWS